MVHAQIIPIEITPWTSRRFDGRSERIDLNQLFDKMSAVELEEYARSGKLPEWFSRTVEGATSDRNPKESNSE